MPRKRVVDPAKPRTDQEKFHGANKSHKGILAHTSGEKAVAHQEVAERMASRPSENAFLHDFSAVDKKYTQTHLQSQRAVLNAKRQELIESLPHLYGYKMYPWMRDFFDSRNRMNLVTAANQVGKALDDFTEIPTPSGFKRMHELRVGDYVFGSDGRPTRILDIPFKGDTECYRVTFGDGSSVVCSGEHAWICKSPRDRFKTETHGKKGQVYANTNFGKWSNVTLNEILTHGKYNPDTTPPRRYVIPMTKPAEYPEKNLFDPYLVGLVIGNGGLTSGSVMLSTCEDYIIEYIRRYEISERPCGRLFCLLGMKEIFTDIGLMGKGSFEKSIPREYLTSSVDERKALLAGLMDTDGTIYGNRAMSYATVSPQLRDDVVELVASLGGSSKVRKKKSGYRDKSGVYIPCRDSYEIIIKTDFCPFKLPRKADKYYEIRYAHERVIYSIEPVGTLPATCITVDNGDGSFLCTRDYIVTHNSSIMIRKAIHWATCPKLWPSLWATTPRQFWYLYPSQRMLEIELKTKWIPEFLPRGRYKDHPVFGWTLEKESGESSSIRFNSGVYIYFKTYMQGANALQAATVHAVFGDEEILEEIYDELNIRLAATDGYFHSAFTATIGQMLWRNAIEVRGEGEMFPNAFKRQVSLYDCMYYTDGTPSHWTAEKIERLKLTCKSELEVDRRIYGRFVTEEGLKYPSFDSKRHFVSPFKIPENWMRFAAVDVGSGSMSLAAKTSKPHPSAIIFIAVNPERTRGYIYKGWRGDEELMTNGDVLQRFRELRGGEQIVRQAYDWSAKDFFVIATRAGEAFEAANKSHIMGEDTINTLFKNDMLYIFDTIELRKLGVELTMLRMNTPKNKAKDDFVDAMRYAVMLVTWDWSYLERRILERDVKPAEEKVLSEKELIAQMLDDSRRGISRLPSKESSWDGDYNSEVQFWNECMGA